MSQPYCPNELSPWARIRFADENREVEVTRHGRSEPATNAKAAGSSGMGEKSWKRRLSSAGSKAFGHGGHTKHGFSQHQKEVGRLNDDDKVNKSQKGALHQSLPNRKHSRRLVTQGHTPELCWYMKTQELSGVAIPPDISNCTHHPTPEDLSTASTSSETSLDLNAHTSLHDSNPDVSTTSETSITQSSTYIETNDTSSLHSTHPSNPDTSSNRSSVTLSSEKKEQKEEEDPFLYIGKYIHNHNAKTTKHSRTHSTARRTKTTPAKACTCASHKCRIYLHSGKPTNHCQNCILPTPQPEIGAAIARINKYHCSVNAVFDNGAETHIPSAKELQKDLFLVETYQAEMEKRCAKGVWWEGWLIVRELEGGGVVVGK